MSVKVSIFIPAMNEEGNIPLLTEKIDRAVKAMPAYDFELIIVNDGSVDNTAGKLLEAKAKYPYLKVFTHKRIYSLDVH